MGWKRAIVLGSVQFLMIAHFVQWYLSGRTLSPVEPSEAMATLKDGIVNTGTVLFAIALLSTVVLGRWFCGWGCHVIMLQDLCAWMLGKVGIRPKPFRSRLLMFVPLALALYMFVWPVVYRIAIAPYVRPDLKWPGFTTNFIVTDYWQSMPGVLMAIPFLFVCGFLIVYLLGAKGYCTYACPYGGFFAPLDEYAIGRIRVTSDCEHCGHCTSVCTSNVRVHEEVRDFGMVVNPGCMKCMDCVSACPNDALYFGFGKPAALAKPRGDAPPAARSYDLTTKEEFAFAAVAFVVFMSVRGTLGVTLPLLFASGVTACVTFAAWKAWRTLRDENVNFHRWRLRTHGSMKPAGFAWLAMTSVVMLLAVGSAAVNTMGFAAVWLDDRITLPPEVVFSGNPVVLDPPLVQTAERAIALYGAASGIRAGGISILPVAQGTIDMRRAWLLSCLGRYEEAEPMLRQTIERDGTNERTAAALGRVLRGQRRYDEAVAWYEVTTAAHPEWRDLQEEYVLWLTAEARTVEAITAARSALARRPDELMYMRRLSLALMQLGAGPEIEEGIQLTDRTLEIAPNNPFAYRALSEAYFRLGKLDESEGAMRKALELAPDDWRIKQALGELLIGVGKAEEGAPILHEARQRGVTSSP
ncbi:MAG: tetratricopeptide repeat protein [Phycisphaerae bacterium]|nr:tetratricopeptide repeat protein [Phycisphaerae bacterium]